MLLRLLLAVYVAFAGTPVFAEETRPPPEAASGETDKSLVIAARHMVVAAEPAAAEAGREMLRQGGSAVDAAIATETGAWPRRAAVVGTGRRCGSCSVGRQVPQVKTFDGRETAPAAAKPDRFLRDGKPMQFEDAVRSG